MQLIDSYNIPKLSNEIKIKATLLFLFYSHETRDKENTLRMAKNSQSHTCRTSTQTHL